MKVHEKRKAMGQNNRDIQYKIFIIGENEKNSDVFSIRDETLENFFYPPIPFLQCTIKCCRIS